MLEPYSDVQDKEAHGDVIVWPLKALCDYIEATGDFAFLDETIAWRREDNFEKTDASRCRRGPCRQADRDRARRASFPARISSATATATGTIRCSRSIRRERDWMASSWTVALLYQQLRRYAEILRRARRGAGDGEGARRARRSDARGLQRLSHSRRRRRRLWRVQPGRRRARTAAASERHARPASPTRCCR